MTTLTQNTIKGTLVFVCLQTPQTKYQSTDKEFKAGVVVDEDTADAWEEMFPKQSAKTVKTSDFKETYKIDAPFPDAKKQYIITLKKPAQYKDGNPLPEQYRPKVLEQDGKLAHDVTKTKLPANGSQGVISFEVNTNDFGTFARLKNVLVTKMIEYKANGGNSGDEFGLEVAQDEALNEFSEQGATNTPETKQISKPKPTPQPNQDDGDETVPF